jgi:hypothetical protein
MSARRTLRPRVHVRLRKVRYVTKVGGYTGVVRSAPASTPRRDRRTPMLADIRPVACWGMTTKDSGFPGCHAAFKIPS